MHHQLGQIAHTMDPDDPDQLPERHDDVPGPTLSVQLHTTDYAYDGDADPSEPGGISRIYKDLVADDGRLEQIVGDVLEAYRRGRKVLPLTMWKAHLERFADRFRQHGLDPIIFTGGGWRQHSARRP